MNDLPIESGTFGVKIGVKPCKIMSLSFFSVLDYALKLSVFGVILVRILRALFTQ